MVLSTPFLVVALAFGLGFLVYISLAILDVVDSFKLTAKGKLKGADITQ